MDLFLIVIDNLGNVCYTYTYNKEGNLVTVEERKTSGNTLVNRQTFTYDEVDRLLTRKDSCTGFTYETLYEKTSSGRIYPDDAVCGVTLSGKYTDSTTKDLLRRLGTRSLTLASASTPLLQDSYTYLGGVDGSTTGFVGTLTQKVKGSQIGKLTYTYDRMGNIESISDASGLMAEYTYDPLNQLKTETDYRNHRKVTYTYDDGGNFTSKKVQTLNASGNVVSGSGVTHTYTNQSAWKDRLASYDGEAIAYDAIGNPIEYKGSVLTWTQGRRLSGYCGNQFKYGADGIRIKKNNTYYTLDGSKILKETTGSTTITYYYGVNGVIGFRYNGTDYYYRKNLQGDIIAIYNTSGTCVVTYAYDAWGKVLSTGGSLASTVGAVNPFRYRSYYYDTETGLYYLQTRYYDPETGRFLNSDALEYLGQGAELRNYNLFAYCDNNPVNRVDEEGTWSLPNWAKVVIGAVATVAAVAITVATGGAAAPVLIGVAASTVGGGAISAISHRVNTGSWDGAIEAALDGAADGFMMGGLSALGGSVISAGIKAVKTSRQGITIGRNMSKGFSNVQNAAGLTDTATYSSDALWKPLRSNYYSWIKKHMGESMANKASYICNKIYIKTMRSMGTVIYDSGLNGCAEVGMFYGMELKELLGYANLIKMF